MKLPIFLLVATLSAQAADRGIVASEFIYQSAPFPQCHASTIAESKAGLVVAWFGGKKEKSPDVGIWLARHVGGKWTPPLEVANGVQADGSRLPCWNPVLFQPRDADLMLFYKVGPDPETWWGMLRTSADDGATWSEARRLPEGFAGPIKNKPVQLADGAILCPTSSEDHGWRVHFERSEDGGKTWTKTGPVNDGKTIGAIQPSILTHKDGSLQAVGRTRGSGSVFTVTSKDEGRTWGELTLGSLPNPNSGTDALTLADGRHLMVYNHTRFGRSPLNVAVSGDGVVWKAAAILEIEPLQEFSYPAVIQTRDGMVHVTYTWKRQRVRHVVVDPGALEVREFADGKWPGK